MRWIQKATDQEMIGPLIAALRSDPSRGIANAAHILAPLLFGRGITDPESASPSCLLHSLICTRPTG